MRLWVPDVGVGRVLGGGVEPAWMPPPTSAREDLGRDVLTEWWAGCGTISGRVNAGAWVVGAARGKTGSFPAPFSKVMVTSTARTAAANAPAAAAAPIR